MAYGEKTDTPPIKTWYYRKCPKCGMKLHVDRRFCACLTDLLRETVFYVDAPQPPKMLGKINFETSRFTCESCGANCSYCASYGMDNTNHEGYGGLDCKHRRDEIQCTCCKILIQNCANKNRNIQESFDNTIKAVSRILEKRGSGQFAAENY